MSQEMLTKTTKAPSEPLDIKNVVYHLTQIVT